MLLYSFALTLGLAAWTLRYIVPMALARRFPAGLAERFGRVPATLACDLAGRRVAWIHAVSVGEVLAASRLVAELGEALGEGWIVYVSTTTATGQKLARERFGAERVFYMPLDFAFAVRAYMRVLKPGVVVLIESEVWPRMMHECRKAGVPVIVVNARVSDRSFTRALKVRWIWSRVLRRASLWLAQSEEDARRLVAMGADAVAVRVGGNLKYDVRASQRNRVAELIREAAAGRTIVVAGSAVDGEESLVLGTWKRVLEMQPTALMILAPRHQERFENVLKLTREYGLWYDSASMIRGMDEANLEGGQVVLLDTIGDLAAVYGIADVAFVGGSLIKRGGHNPLEPAQFGVPVVIGPSYENFREIVREMIDADGIRIVKDEAELEIALVQLLTDREAARAMGERGRRVFEQQQGATARAVAAVLEMVRGGVSQ